MTQNNKKKSRGAAHGREALPSWWGGWSVPWHLVFVALLETVKPTSEWFPDATDGAAFFYLQDWAILDGKYSNIPAPWSILGPSNSGTRGTTRLQWSGKNKEEKTPPKTKLWITWKFRIYKGLWIESKLWNLPRTIWCRDFFQNFIALRPKLCPTPEPRAPPSNW